MGERGDLGRGNASHCVGVKCHMSLLTIEPAMLAISKAGYGGNCLPVEGGAISRRKMMAVLLECGQ